MYSNVDTFNDIQLTKTCKSNAACTQNGVVATTQMLLILGP